MNQEPGLLCLFLLTALLFFSCERDAPECKGNCETMNANGRVINNLTGTGASGVPVKLSWSLGGGLPRGDRLVIQTVNSDGNGAFNFTSSIDTTYFSKDYHLSLYVGDNDEYMILGYAGVNSKPSYAFDQSAFQNVQLEVYKKANLKIRLHRTQSDNFTSFIISHSNVDNYFFVIDYNVQSPQEVIDKKQSELNVNTVADVYTKIKVEKTFADGTSKVTIDSIKCTTNATSIYDVNF